MKETPLFLLLLLATPSIVKPEETELLENGKQCFLFIWACVYFHVEVQREFGTEERSNAESSGGLKQ